MEIASIIIASIALVSSIISPIIIATASFINRIHESDCCCCGHIELSSLKQEIKNTLETRENPSNNASLIVKI